MKPFFPEQKIEDHEGFSKDKDIFRRRPLGEGLTSLIENVADPIVIAIDGQWGSGKTVFLKMWAGELRNQGFPVIYFDAFEHDYFEDAFLAIAGEIIELAGSRDIQKGNSFEQFKKTAVDVSKILLRAGLKMGVRAATLGVAKVEDFGDAAEAIAAEAEDLFDKHLGEMITKRAKEKSTIESFRTSLSEFPALYDANNNQKENHQPKPLVFIIDELDRCRPPFALQTLERMKHFFSVQNVHFVLGTNLGQLANSVSASYGVGIDAVGYLQKFINVTIPLAKSRPGDRFHELTAFLRHLHAAIAVNPQQSNFLDDCEHCLLGLATRAGLSLRTVQRIYTNIILAIFLNRADQKSKGPILTGLATLKVIDPELYQDTKSERIEYHRHKNVLQLSSTLNLADNNEFSWFVSVWKAFADPDATVEELNNARLWDQSIESRLRIIALTAALLDGFSVS